MDEATDTRLENELLVVFTRKSVWDHVLGVLSRWHTLLLTALGIFGVIWTMFEAPAYLLESDLSDSRFYVGALLASVFGAIVWTIREYTHDCPPGFEHESLGARRIAQLQRTRWEHRLAAQLLQDVLTDLDDELAALSEGRVFVPIESAPDFRQYISWAGLGPSSVLRMVDVGQKLLVLDLPSALGAANSPSKPREIRATVYRIRDLYAETVAFERGRRAVKPPDGAERLHELQLGWTDPVREGVRQMFEYFERVRELPLKGDQQLTFTMTMGEFASSGAFCEELDRLERLGLHLQ